MPACWLLKTEPSDYSFDDLTRDKSTVWDGVANALALKHLRSVKKGDRAIIYHTGKEKSAVGTATVASAPYADPHSDDDKLVVIDLKAGKRLARPVALAELKAEPAFEGSEVLRIGRLSVAPLTEAMYDRVVELAADGAKAREAKS